MVRGQPSVSCALFSLPVSSQRCMNMCLVILTVAVVSFASMLVLLDISSFSNSRGSSFWRMLRLVSVNETFSSFSKSHDKARPGGVR